METPDLGTAPTSVETPPAPPPATERVADKLQAIIQGAIGAHRRPPRRLKTLLHGSWLGHPLHPVLTDIPLGAWPLAAIFDLLWLFVPQALPWAPRGSEVLVVVGLLGALGAAVTGMADWSDTYGAERATGLYHGLLNVGATVLYIVSLALRLPTPDGASIAGAIVGFAGLGLLLFAAYLGGDMVFAKGTGVNHTAWEPAPEEFEPVLPVAAIPENTLRRVVTASGVPVILVRIGDQYSALAATCTHAGGPLDEGKLEGGVVECPWHGSRFRMRDGHVLTGPATVRQPRYDVRVRDGQIEIKLGGRT